MKTEARLVSLNKQGWPYCPFRGLPHISLDYRCPSTISVTEGSIETLIDGEVPVEVVEDEDAPKKRGRPRIHAEKQTKSIPLLYPVLSEEDHPTCWHCLQTGLREREQGREVRKPRK